MILKTQNENVEPPINPIHLTHASGLLINKTAIKINKKFEMGYLIPHASLLSKQTSGKLGQKVTETRSTTSHGRAVTGNGIPWNLVFSWVRKLGLTQTQKLAHVESYNLN